MPSVVEWLLVPTSLEITAGVSARECAERLRELNDPRKSKSESGKVIVYVVIDERTSKEFDVEIRAKRPPWRGADRYAPHTIVRVTGTIRDNAAGHGVLSGHFTFGVYYFLFAVGVTVLSPMVILILLDDKSFPRSIPFLALFVLMVTAAWWMLINDRKTLRNKIESVLRY